MNSFARRRSRRAQRRPALVLALLAAMSLPGCGSEDDGDQAAGAPDAELTARLHDNATARDLAAQLPLTLTFRDHNNVEKTAPLPRELSLEDAPQGHDPAAGDIGYWAPGGDVVLYYDDDAPYFNGIVRIGEFDGAMGSIERLPEDTSVTVARAD